MKTRDEIEALVLKKFSEIRRELAPRHDDRHCADLLIALDYAQTVLTLVSASAGGVDFAVKNARRMIHHFSDPAAWPARFESDDWIDGPFAGHA